MIAYDSTIADAIAAGHAYDIVSFDFKTAFDKASNKFVYFNAP